MPKKITQNVNKDKYLNDLPKVSPEMSSWLNKHTNYLSCNAGDIIPIYYVEVLPKERKKIVLAMSSHTSTPVAPMFPAMYTEVRSFFIPMRLASDLLNGYKDRKSPWVKVFGEDNTSTNSDIIVPLDEQKLPDFDSDFVTAANSYLGGYDDSNNIFNFLDIDGGQAFDISGCNFLQLSAYELVYQRHYRNENYESATESDLYKFLYNAYNGSTSSLPTTFTFEKANREKDYFTGAKPFTQKSNEPVRISVGDKADVLFESTSSATTGTIPANTELDKMAITEATLLKAGSTGKIAVGSSTVTAPGKLIADLKNVQGISIEELRLLIKTQELLEKDAIYGSRYAESLNAHFGTCPLDLTLQEPQELYRTTITSNMQAIFQTSSTTGESSILGTIGANSTTQTEPFVILPETEFKEHGILMICAVHKLQNVYDSMFFKPKFIYKKSRFDFYTPELNDLGYQPVTDKEMLTGSAGIKGYNEAFAEYRYSFNKVHGRLADEFPYWAPAISSEYGSIAALYKEAPGILDKALSVRSTSAPQFYDAWGFVEECTKPMSLHSIPGMDGVI